MSSTPIQPGWPGLVLACLFMLVMLTAARINHIPIFRHGLVAMTRSTAQLLLVGMVLGEVFDLEDSFAVLGVLATMIAAATWTARGQVRAKLPHIALLMGVVLASVALSLLLLVLRGALGLQGVPARYAIPLFGIILGNAMTAATLAANHYNERIAGSRGELEAALALGATPAQADASAFNTAFLTAVTPVLNAMLIVGIVKLPGIMSGQLLAGSSPWIAAQYQLMVMFILATGDGATALWVLRLLRKRHFNDVWQLRS